MTRPDWGRLQELFARALELEPAQREAFVVEAAGSDAELLGELRAMLAQHDAAPAEFLSPPDVGGEEDDAIALVGARLGDFQVLRPIGRGNMGVVFEARQLSLERRVAIKVLREGFLTSRTQVERFHREAKAAARLQHPHIVRVLADGTHERTHWFAMELVDGHDLDEDLQKQRDGAPAILPTEMDAGEMRAAARVVAEIAEALEHAHAAGLVHRDVKPSNILLACGGRALLADFGIARDESLGKLTRTGVELGSLYYMSPEQARLLETPVDHRTDVYSLGVVLYELLARRRPFGGKTQPEVLRAIQRGEAADLRTLKRGISRELATVCAKAMHRDVDKRYATARDFGADLRRFLRGEAVHAKPPTAYERALRWMWRHRVAAAVLFALLVGALLQGRNLALAREVEQAHEAFRRATKATTDITVLDEHGQLARGVVYTRRLAFLTGIPEARQRLGELPLRDAFLEPGFFRLIFEFEDGRVREISRELLAGFTKRVTYRIAPPVRQVYSDMLLVRGGTLTKQPWATWPAAEVPLAEPVALEDFYLDRYEVSNGDWRRFLATRDDAYRAAATPDYWSQVEPGSDRDELPVTQISWQHAHDYAEWAGKRLPTLSEWNWVARNREEWSRVPWASDTPWPGLFEARAKSPKSVADYFAYMLPVRSHVELATRDKGFHWMLGNAQEWTETPAWTKFANGERAPDRLTRHALGLVGLAGTGWLDLRAASHPGIGPANRMFYRGFRCARSVYVSK